MIIKYDFLCKLTGEVTEIEVNDELGKIVEEIEKKEFKNNRTETRRHNYISELEEQGYYIADDIDTFDEVIKSVQYKNLWMQSRNFSHSSENCCFVFTGKGRNKRK